MKSRPIEVVNASKACAEAWARRDAMLDAGDLVGVSAMNTACQFLDQLYSLRYRTWQILGGTSDIDSIALFDPRTPQEIEADERMRQVKEYFGDNVKVTKTWLERHT